MTYRVLIVDDERLSRVVLRELLSDHPDMDIVGEASSVADAVRSIEGLDPDIVFLDIQLPDGLGFDLFKKTEVNAEVIFVTAYDEHALRAFEVNALDYLVKPVDPESMARAIERVKRRGSIPHESSTPAPSPTSAPSSTPAPSLTLDDIICLQETNCMKFTQLGDIVSIVAADDYSEVYLRDGETILANQRLRSWDGSLPSSFVRVHRSAIVNLHFVKDITKVDGKWFVRFKTEQKPLTMSRRFAQSMKKTFSLKGGW